MRALILAAVLLYTPTSGLAALRCGDSPQRVLGLLGIPARVSGAAWVWSGARALMTPRLARLDTRALDGTEIILLECR